MKNIMVEFFFGFNKQCNCDALLNIKDIFIFASIWRRFFFKAASMKIENKNLIKGLHQTLTHASKGGVIEVAVVGDHGNNAPAGFVDLPLGKAQKLVHWAKRRNLT